MFNRTRCVVLCGLALLLCLSAHASAAPPKEKRASPPDLTRGGVRTNIPDWNLGATGARGWIFGLDFDTSDARQILVAEVDEGSPAHGVLMSGDVILGVAGHKFSRDARAEMAQAIAAAESEAHEKQGKTGELKLLVWRDKAVKSVSLNLATLPPYAATAPFDCAKSAAIVVAGCRAIAARGFHEGALDAPVRGDNWDPSVSNSVDALALLSSGDAQYREILRDYAHRVGPANLDLVLREGLYAWTWGYANLFLTEYFLATGDADVLPAITEYSHKIAIGQSEVGTWGHGFRVDGNNGTLGGYGAINQCGLVCWMSLILAEKCGISDERVHNAIALSRQFFSFYVGKGSVPYGDHPPYWLHDDNGKSGAAAVAFDLLGDHAGTQFFSRMATAAYGEKELGHTGNYLGYLWGALGASRAGAPAVTAFLEQQRWYYDLARRADGSFFTNKRDNYDWPMTGVFVLHHALPLHTLMITGRELHAENQLVGSELQEVMRSGEGFNLGPVDTVYAAKTTTQLMRALSDWSPTVRTRAARVLVAHKDEADKIVPRLIRMLRSEELATRIGACMGLEAMGGRAAPATELLIEQLDDADMWLRIRAAFALTAIGSPALKAVPELLSRCTLEQAADPRGMEAKYLAFALFRADFVDQIPPQPGLISQSLEGVDRALVYPAIRRMLASDDGLGTMSMRSIFRTMSVSELQPLLPAIVRVANETAPSGEMFAQEIRVEALRFMAQNQIAEGMPVFIEYARTQNGWGSKTKEILPLLQLYGTQARVILPQLKELHQLWKKQDAASGETSDGATREKTKAEVAAEVIRAIEASA